MLTTIILSLAGVILLILAGVVLYSNYRAAANRWLGGFILSGFLWLVANLLANLVSSPDLQLYFSRAAIVGPALLPVMFLMFCISFSGRSITKARRVALFVPVAILLATAPTALNVQSVRAGGDEIVPGNAYLLLLIVFVTYFSLGVFHLVREFRHSQRARKLQLYYILFGTGLTVVPGLILSGILPIFGYSDAVSFSPVVVLIFSIATTIAIVQHSLFDIRFIIVRSITYLLSVFVMASIYGFIAFGLAGYLFDLHVPFLAQLLLSIATAFSALAFPVIHRRFDKFTNKFFYRDSYDSQQLFGRLNGMLVSSLDMRYLMNQSIAIIEETIKTEFAIVGLRKGPDGYRMFSKRKILFSEKDIDLVRHITPKMSDQKVIVADYLDDPSHARLKAIMRRYNIAVIVRLAQDTRLGKEGLGYLVLGDKKSGNSYSSQDVQVLSTVGNELTIAIQNVLHYEEIQQFNIELQGKVDEATRKLRRTNEKLKALDETKDDFISMASHQLRTPLTSVKGYLSMVLEEDAGKINATQQKMLAQAFTSSQRMVYLIADLLNVSRLRTGKFVIDAAPTNLAVMIEEELAQLVEAAKARDLELTFAKPKDFPDLMLDETKIRQVVMNFIDNAIYYTPSGGHIQVELISNDKVIELRVSDDGIGVPKAEQHHLFTKFYRAGNARKARPDGTGLGLFMAKKVVAAQGGSVLFTSVEGKGSTFGFSFSRSKLALQPVPLVTPEVKPAKAPTKR